MKWEDIAYWCWRGEDNLGDAAINDYLMPKWFPGIKTDTYEKPSAVLMPIGSILGFRKSLPKGWKDVPWLIFGAGFQYGVLDIPKDSLAFCLRGQLTLDLVSKNCPSAIMPYALTDPAIGLPLYLPKTDQARFPHATINKWDWHAPWGEKDPHVFSSRVNRDFEGWIKRLWQYEKITTTSLHAAIIADAYGIPWRPLLWELKWQDHFEQFGITSQPKDFVLTDRTALALKQDDLELARHRLKVFVSGR